MYRKKNKKKIKINTLLDLIYNSTIISDYTVTDYSGNIRANYYILLTFYVSS